MTFQREAVNGLEYVNDEILLPILWLNHIIRLSQGLLIRSMAAIFLHLILTGDADRVGYHINISGHST